MSKVTIYTPQKFLEQVRQRIALATIGLTREERILLMAVPVTYRPWPEMPEGKRQVDIGGHLMGATEPFGTHVYIFGEEHHGDQDQMARSLVHELAHVLTLGHEHDATFIAKEAQLGLATKRYVRDAMFDGMLRLTYSCMLASTNWDNKELADFIRALPQVEWGPRVPFATGDNTIVNSG